MAQKKMSQKAPPNPDPERYIIVKTKEGYYTRLRRGFKSPARLNEVLSQRVDWTRQVMPVAKKIVTALRPFLEKMDPGRLTVRINSLLIRSLQEGKQMDYRLLKNMELQPRHPLELLLPGQFRVEQPDRQTIRITVPGDAVALKRQSSLVTGYRLAAVLLSGDPGGQQELVASSTESERFPRNKPEAAACVLTLELPEPGIPWLVCLKVVCMEGAEEAIHPAWKGMRVIAVGRA